jgi:hypothetical protein
MADKEIEKDIEEIKVSILKLQSLIESQVSQLFIRSTGSCFQNSCKSAEAAVAAG